MSPVRRGASPTRILLVEPDEKAAADMSLSLEGHPEWEVTRVGSLLEAIRVAGETPFQAAVLDYDLPDGTGLDILDFLRIGSPGIQIVLVSDRGSEDIVFHALSHGVGDYLVKDSHLGQELARRIDALLDRGANHVVDTLTAATKYDKAPVDEDRATPVPESALDRALGIIVGGPILAAGIFDSRGKVIAARFYPGLDPDGAGFALATIHGQIGALWTYAELKPLGYEMLVEVDAGLLAVTAIPGTFVVALLMERQTEHDRALERLEMAARKVFETLRG